MRNHRQIGRRNGKPQTDLFVQRIDVVGRKTIDWSNHSETDDVNLILSRIICATQNSKFEKKIEINSFVNDKLQLMITHTHLNTNLPFDGWKVGRRLHRSLPNRWNRIVSPLCLNLTTMTLCKKIWTMMPNCCRSLTGRPDGRSPKWRWPGWPAIDRPFCGRAGSVRPKGRRLGAGGRRRRPFPAGWSGAATWSGSSGGPRPGRARPAIRRRLSVPSNWWRPFGEGRPTLACCGATNRSPRGSCTTKWRPPLGNCECWSIWATAGAGRPVPAAGTEGIQSRAIENPGRR